jgi:hypothetical protein
MKAVFPAVVSAAQTLGRDADLVGRLQQAEGQLLPYPRTDIATQQQQLPPSADATGQDMIGFSYEQAAKTRNVENLGLEPVWPWGLISDDGPLSDLAKRTYVDRPFVERNDWSFDPIDAARLGLADQMRQTAVDLTEQYQKRISGLASFGSSYPEQYAEQGGVITTALQDSLVQDYDGVLRIAPAWPSDWDADGTVYIQHRTKVDVQLRGGVPVTIAIESGADHPITMRNPWPGQQVEVVSGTSGQRVMPATDAATFTIPAQAAHSYIVQRVSAPSTSLGFAPVTGTPATEARHLGPVQIGLDAVSR